MEHLQDEDKLNYKKPDAPKPSQEISKATRMLKNGKSKGLVNIPVEKLKTRRTKRHQSINRHVSENLLNVTQEISAEQQAGFRSHERIFHLRLLSEKIEAAKMGCFVVSWFSRK